MKIEILQEELLRGLNTVLRAASVRAQLPILSFVKMKVDQQGILLVATDLEMGIALRVNAKTVGEGEVAIPGKMLAEFLGTVTPGKTELEITEGKLKIRSGGAKAELLTGNVEDFPQLPQFEGLVARTKVEEVASTIETVVFACAKDSLRPALTGVLFEIGKQLRMVATDGFRLAVGEVENEEKREGEQTLLIPSRAVAELTKIFYGGELEIGYLEKTKQVLFRQGEIMLISQLIDGNFPDYQRILPKEFGIEVTTTKSELLAAVKTAFVFARDNSNMMRWKVGEGKIIITSSSPSRGECSSELEVKIEGEATEVVFNAKYVMDYLMAPGEEGLWIGLGGKLSPGMMREAGKKNGFYVVMPINA